MSSVYEFYQQRAISGLKPENRGCLNLLRVVKQASSAHFYQDNLVAVCEILLCEILDKKHAQLYLEAPILNQKEFYEFEHSLNSILLGKPLAFILGKADFFGLEFCLDENCFIPRPETEILVEKTLDICKTLKKKQLLIYDLCTGTGSIAVSLTKSLTYCKITATDISQKSLKFARKNALRHKVGERIDFICCDLAQGIKRNTKADIIVSNPPYIKRGEIELLPENVKKEPLAALDGGRDGLEVVKKLFDAARIHLKKSGYLIFEFGNGQAAEVNKIAVVEGIFSKRQIIKDYNGMDRFFIGRKA